MKKATVTLTSARSMFINSDIVENPDVVVPKIILGKREYVQETIKGRFRRVFPKDSREWSAIRMMDLHEDRYAPAKGNGIIISEKAFMSFN